MDDVRAYQAGVNVHDQISTSTQHAMEDRLHLCRQLLVEQRPAPVTHARLDPISFAFRLWRYGHVASFTQLHNSDRGPFDPYRYQSSLFSKYFGAVFAPF